MEDWSFLFFFYLEQESIQASRAQDLVSFLPS